MSRGWILDLHLEDSTDDEAWYTVRAHGWQEGLIREKSPLVGRVPIERTSRRYDFELGGAWSQEAIPEHQLSGRCPYLEHQDALNELHRSIVQFEYRWWFYQLVRAVAQALASESFPKNVFRYQ